ncbi:MAG: competence protein [Sphingobacteriales bacterium]|nr:competence protein [Sphingobacteriales bacterium]
MDTHFINTDLVKVYRSETKKDSFLTVLAWGDEVTLIEKKAAFWKISLKNFVVKEGSLVAADTTGFILRTNSNKSFFDSILAPIANKKVLSVSFVDVQQGDGSVIETPKGKVMLIDGGESAMYGRYLAARYQGSSLQDPKIIDCIVVSHGDADHFEGLPLILESETHSNPRKRLFMHPKKVYHNGIIKRPSSKNGKKVADKDLLGPTIKQGNETYLTDLVDDLLDVPDTDMNKPFKAWKSTLATYKSRNSNIRIRRLDDKSKNEFSFLNDEKIKVDVLGPVIEEVNGKSVLKFLRQPGKNVELEEDSSKGSLSASHTINGHSVILRIKYGNVKFLFAGDLNEEAEDILVNKTKNGEPVLPAEVLKVPHHGSADFSNKFFEAVQPLVSIVSSGDESEAKEYIHPRATLMGVLGKYSRHDRPLVFVTELAAFFKYMGTAKSLEGNDKGKNFYAFKRTSFGIINIRTDGSRLFVFTHSGQKDLKEAYAFEIAADGTATRKNVAIA